MSFSTCRLGDDLPLLKKKMTQGIIDSWASVSGDRNPLHVDPEFAKSTRFGGTIAHGHIALSYLCQLLQDWSGAAWMKGGKLIDIKFIAPIRPGHTYQVGGTVSEVTPDAVRVRLHIRNAADGQDCIEGMAELPRGGSAHAS